MREYRRLNVEKNEKLKKVYPLITAYILMIFVMFVLPFYSFEGYCIIKNTTSHLGAQGAPNAWIMNIVFILLGAASVVAGWLNLKQFWFQKIILTVFGLALIMTGIFQHAPLLADIPYSVRNDELHSFFYGGIDSND